MQMNRVQIQPGISLPEFFARYGTVRVKVVVASATQPLAEYLASEARLRRPCRAPG